MNMITTEEVVQRLETAFKALEEKRNVIVGVVTFAPATPAPSQMQALIGSILMSLSEHGLTIENETFTRTLGVVVTMMQHYGLHFSQDDILQRTECVDDTALKVVSTMKKHQLISFCASSLSSEIDSCPDMDDDEDKHAFVYDITCICRAVILFVIMHGMNEQSIIADIPNAFELKL